MTQQALSGSTRFPVLCAADGKVLVDVQPAQSSQPIFLRPDWPRRPNRWARLSPLTTRLAQQIHQCHDAQNQAAAAPQAQTNPYRLISLAENEARHGRTAQAKRLLEAAYAAFDGALMP